MIIYMSTKELFVNKKKCICVTFVHIFLSINIHVRLDIIQHCYAPHLMAEFVCMPLSYLSRVCARVCLGCRTEKK